MFRKSAIIEVLPPPAADPIAGRYRLLKTENFDEFMKRLGVGLIKRKLANSVSPQNVIIINDDGKYQINIHLSSIFHKINYLPTGCLNFLFETNILLG